MGIASTTVFSFLLCVVLLLSFTLLEIESFHGGVKIQPKLLLQRQRRQQKQQHDQQHVNRNSIAYINSRYDWPSSLLMFSSKVDDDKSDTNSTPTTTDEYPQQSGGSSSNNNDVEVLIDASFQDRTSSASSSIQLVLLELKDHQPMGCTVEESLDDDDNDYVFVSRVTKESNAERSGMKVGDVIVAMTGPFGNNGDNLSIVLDAGVEKIKSMVSAVPKNETLIIQVARGTDVLERHEQAIVELCSVSETSDKDVQDCVVNFLADGYYDDIGDATTTTPSVPAAVTSTVADDSVETKLKDTETDEEDEDGVDTDGLIDNMYSMWADEDDLPLPLTTSGIADNNSGTQQNQKPKPWSSRSSPSGTFVRDPKTGQMRNIDPA